MALEAALEPAPGAGVHQLDQLVLVDLDQVLQLHPAVEELLQGAGLPGLGSSERVSSGLGGRVVVIITQEAPAAVTMSGQQGRREEKKDR